jgi:ABC-type sulfate transport system permease component
MAFIALPVSWRDAQEMVRKIADAANSLGDGRSNATGTVTLTAAAASTAVTDRRVGTDSVIALMPTTANASGEIGAGTIYIATVTAGSFTITHANNAQADRTYSYSIQG